MKSLGGSRKNGGKGIGRDQRSWRRGSEWSEGSQKKNIQNVNTHEAV